MDADPSRGRRRLLQAAAALLLVPAALLGASDRSEFRPGAGQHADSAAIRAAVFDYFEGINEVDEVRLRRAFAAHANLKSVSASGQLNVEPIEAAIGRWLAAAPQARSGAILSLDVADGGVARVVFDFDGRYTDYLTLMRLAGEWRIIDKVFVAR
jgi:protease I